MARLSETEVADFARSVGSSIPVGFFVGTALKESGYDPNNISTDYYPDGSVKKISYGLYQISDEGGLESQAVNMYGGINAMLEPTAASGAFAFICETRLAEILNAAGLSAPTRDAYLYLAWAHNYGQPTILKSISQYGMDWEAAKIRNASLTHFTTKLVKYAETIYSFVEKYGSGAQSVEPESGGEDVAAGAVALGSCTDADQVMVFVMLFALYWFWKAWRGEPT